MKTSTLLLLLLPLTLPVQAAENPGRKNDALCVMTFNLRFASPKPPNAWPQRRPVLRECLEQAAPDLIGTQEGVYQQLIGRHNSSSISSILTSIIKSSPPARKARR